VYLTTNKEAGMFFARSFDVERSVQEPQAHRIELYMQKDDLKRARRKTKKSRKKHVDLYDFAPVACFSFDHKGVTGKITKGGNGWTG
jgi:hypothetical protein